MFSRGSSRSDPMHFTHVRNVEEQRYTAAAASRVSAGAVGISRPVSQR